MLVVFVWVGDGVVFIVSLEGISGGNNNLYLSCTEISRENSKNIKL